MWGWWVNMSTFWNCIRAQLFCLFIYYFYLNFSSFDYFFLETDWDDTEITTPEPPGLGYNVEIKIVNLGENYKAPKPGTEEFKQFTNTLDNNLKNVFKKVPGYKRMVVENIVE